MSTCWPVTRSLPDGELDARVQHLQQRLVDVLSVDPQQRIQLVAGAYEPHEHRTPPLGLLVRLQDTRVLERGLHQSNTSCISPTAPCFEALAAWYEDCC
jgi:hypothetical protein